MHMNVKTDPGIGSEKRPEVHQELDKLNDALINLEGTSRELHDRLGPVLRDLEPESVGDGVAKTLNTDLSRQLSEYHHKTAEINNLLINTIQRLEI